MKRCDSPMLLIARQFVLLAGLRREWRAPLAETVFAVVLAEPGELEPLYELRKEMIDALNT